MSTIRSQIVEAAIARLNASPPAGVPQAEEDRGGDLEPTQLPAISVSCFREKVEPAGGHRWSPMSDRQLVLAVDCWAQATSGSALREAMDPMLDWVTARLSGWREPTLQTAETTEVEVQWARARKDNLYSKATVFIAVPYQTVVNNAAAAA